MKQLDIIFAKYIKHRDTLQGFGVCIYCGGLVHRDQSQACHCVKRSNSLLRYDEINVNIGHETCNQNDNREQLQKGIDKKYGAGTYDRLMSQRFETHKFYKFELEEKLKFYKQKIKEYESR